MPKCCVLGDDIVHVLLVGHDHPKLAFISFIIALNSFNYPKTVTNLISIGCLLEGHFNMVHV